MLVVFGPFRVNHRERDPRSSVVGALAPTRPNKPKKEESRPLWFLIEQGDLVTVDDWDFWRRAGDSEQEISCSPSPPNLPPLCVGLSGNGWVRGGARAVVGLHPAGILLVRLGGW